MKHLVWLAGSAAILSSIGGVASAQEVKLRLVSFVPANTAFGIPAKRWVDELNRRGKGLVQVDMVGPEAVPVPEQANAVKTGVVDLHSGPPTFYNGTLIEAETFNLSEKSIDDLKKNGAWEFLDKLHGEKMNSKLLTGFGYGITFHIYTTRPANAADKKSPFTGFNLRATPSYKAFFESLGAKVVPTAPGEVFTALERNMVQGYGWPLLGIKDMGWIKMTRYRYDPGFFNVSVHIMINQDRWKSLNPKQQEVVAATSRWVDEQWPKWRDEFAAEEEKIQKEGGVQIVNLGPEFRQRAYDAFWADLEGKSPKNIAYLKKLMTK